MDYLDRILEENVILEGEFKVDYLIELEFDPFLNVLEKYNSKFVISNLTNECLIYEIFRGERVKKGDDYEFDGHLVYNGLIYLDDFKREYTNRERKLKLISIENSTN